MDLRFYTFIIWKIAISFKKSKQLRFKRWSVMSVRIDLESLKDSIWCNHHVCIKPIKTQDDEEAQQSRLSTF